MTNGQNENIEFGITLAEKQISCKKNWLKLQSLPGRGEDGMRIEDVLIIVYLYLALYTIILSLVKAS